MTIQQYREYLSKGGTIDCYGMNFSLLPQDRVIIINNLNDKMISNNIELLYKTFLDLQKEIASGIKNLEITGIEVKLNEYIPHTYNLVLDTIEHKNNKEKIENGISAGMKYK